MEQGLLQQQMPPEQMPEQMPEQPEEGAEVNESDPVFQAYMQALGQGLYETGAASKIANALGRSGGEAQSLADVTYELINLAGDKVGQEIDPELLSLLAMTALEEVTEIAKAGGVEVTGAIAGKALQIMILRFLGEMGHDTRELQAAMDQVDPAMFDEAAQEQPAQEQPEGMLQPPEQMQGV